MVIFNSYFDITRGYSHGQTQGTHHSPTVAKLRRWRSRGVPAHCRSGCPMRPARCHPHRAGPRPPGTSPWRPTGMEGDGGVTGDELRDFFFGLLELKKILYIIVSYKIKIHYMISYYMISLYHDTSVNWLGSWMGDFDIGIHWGGSTGCWRFQWRTEVQTWTMESRLQGFDEARIMLNGLQA